MDEEQELTPKEIREKNRRNLRKKLRQLVRDNVNFEFTYYMPLIFSSIIATLGLLTDSAPVVIGAMLIAPLFWPILGVSFGVITNRERLFQKSFFLLLLSIVLALLISGGIAYLTPMESVTQEIEARVNPTVMDLLIALASSIIGIVALYWPQISSSIAGVAISVALLPPLCTTGIGIALGSWTIVRGAALLFGANIGAIIFAGLVTLVCMGFRPDREKDSKRLVLGAILSLVFLILIGIPLVIYFKDTLIQTSQRNQVREVLEEQLANVSDNAALSELEIGFETAGGSREIQINATIFLPEGMYLTVDKKNQLTEALAQKTDSSISLQLNIVNKLVLRREEDEEKKSLREQIVSYIESTLAQIDRGIVVEQIEIAFPEGENDNSAITATLLVRQSEEAGLDYEQKNDLEDSLTGSIGQQVDIEIDYIPVTRIEEQDEMTRLTAKVHNLLIGELGEISSQIEIDQLEVLNNSNGLSLEVTLRLPEQVVVSYDEKQLIQKRLAAELEQKVDLELRLLGYDVVEKEIVPPESPEQI